MTAQKTIKNINIKISTNNELFEEFKQLRKKIINTYNQPLTALIQEVRVFRDRKAFDAFVRQFRNRIWGSTSVFDFIDAVIDVFLNSDYNYDMIDSTMKKGAVAVTDLASCPFYVLAKKMVIAKGDKKYLEHYKSRFAHGNNIHQLMNSALKLAKTEGLNLDLEGEVWIAIKLKDGYWLTGRVDLVDFTNNIIIDYKTFQQQKIDKLSDDMIQIFNQNINQLLLYQTALSIWSGQKWSAYIVYLVSTFDDKQTRKFVRHIDFDLKRVKLMLTIAHILPLIYTDDEQTLQRHVFALWYILRAFWGEGEQKVWGDYCTRFCPFNPLNKRRFKLKKENGEYKPLFTCPIPLLMQGRMPTQPIQFKASKEALKNLGFEVETE